jgi:hypothetical protein
MPAAATYWLLMLISFEDGHDETTHLLKEKILS